MGKLIQLRPAATQSGPNEMAIPLRAALVCAGTFALQRMPPERLRRESERLQRDESEWEEEAFVRFSEALRGH